MLGEDPVKRPIGSFGYAVKEVLRQIVTQLRVREGRESQLRSHFVRHGLLGIDKLPDDLQLTHISAEDVASQIGRLRLLLRQAKDIVQRKTKVDAVIKPLRAHRRSDLPIHSMAQTSAQGLSRLQCSIGGLGMTNLLSCRGVFGERGILTAVAKHLLSIAFGIGRTHIGDTALGIVDQLKAGIDEALVGGDIKRSIATQYLGMKLGIYVDSVALY